MAFSFQYRSKQGFWYQFCSTFTLLSKRYLKEICTVDQVQPIWYLLAYLNTLHWSVSVKNTFPRKSRVGFSKSVHKTVGNPKKGMDVEAFTGSNEDRDKIYALRYYEKHSDLNGNDTNLYIRGDSSRIPCSISTCHPVPDRISSGPWDLITISKVMPRHRIIGSKISFHISRPVHVFINTPGKWDGRGKTRSAVLTVQDQQRRSLNRVSEWPLLLSITLNRTSIVVDNNCPLDRQTTLFSLSLNVKPVKIIWLTAATASGSIKTIEVAFFRNGLATKTR